MSRDNLGEFEQLVLLAILRLGSEAYGLAVLAEIERQTKQAASIGSLYVTLDRLEDKGLIRSRLAKATDARGGRPRRYVTATPRAINLLRASRRALLNLWDGLETVFDG